MICRFRKSIFVTAAAISFIFLPALSQEDPAAPSAPPPPPPAAPAGQEMPASRPKYDIELNKDSSSFVPDPDSLDPLPLKKESLKEDDEPVLDDIKSILKTKAKKPKAGAAKPGDGAAAAPVKKAKKKVTRKKAKKSAPVVDTSNLSPDDPDLALEQKFNDIYNKYNINPTSDDVWGAASSKAAQVYDVQKGDTLFTISRTLFGDPQFWPKIWALNNGGITNPHNIAPGTKIYFYPGDGGAAPSMSVGSESPERAAWVDPDAPVIRDTTTKQNTEFNKLVQEGVKGKTDVQNIPPSFPPFSVSSKYFAAAKSTKFLITPAAEIVDRDPENPFILTSSIITTEYKVMEKNANSLVCKDNQYVPAVLKIGKNAKPGRYSMLVQESFNFGQLKRTYIYRIIGEADVGSDESLRISQCIKPVNTDVLLVSSEDLAEVKPPSELIPNTRSQIIEGVEVNAQQYYYAHQYVILNMSQLPALEGADLKVYSASAGGVVGEIRILKRTGTMAIGYVMNNDDLVQVGDRVIIPE